MAQGVFKFHVQNLSFGNCRVTMLINDKEIHYDASYIGDNPLATLIDACADLLDTSGLAYIYGDGRHFIEWQAEPGTLSIDLTLDKEGMLHFDIVDDKDRNDIENPEWHEVIPFDAFLSAVMEEGFRVLNAFGLCGYRTSWCNDTDFPLTNLLRITGKCEELRKGDSFTTDIVKEIEVLQNHISKFKITEEKRMDECTVYYESWQLQCCGDPFSVGDNVEWSCFQSEYKNAHGIVLDFDENHHGFAAYSVSGIVNKIIAERSEFPKGKRETWYEKAMTIHEEIQHADGWESELKDDDTTERTFWGYIIELKDVIVKPLKNDKQS